MISKYFFLMSNLEIIFLKLFYEIELHNLEKKSYKYIFHWECMSGWSFDREWGGLYVGVGKFSKSTKLSHIVSFIYCFFLDTRTRLPCLTVKSSSSFYIYIALITMRKIAADRFRRLFNRSLLLLPRHSHNHPPFPASSSISSHSLFSPYRFLFSTPFSSMASDSPFPVTAQNINPKVCASFNSLSLFSLLGVLKLQALICVIVFFYLGKHDFELIILGFSLLVLAWCNVFVCRRIDLWLNYSCFLLRKACLLLLLLICDSGLTMIFFLRCFLSSGVTDDLVIGRLILYTFICPIECLCAS